jgi:hypothetical protein
MRDKEREGRGREKEGRVRVREEMKRKAMQEETYFCVSVHLYLKWKEGFLGVFQRRWRKYPYQKKKKKKKK